MGRPRKPLELHELAGTTPHPTTVRTVSDISAGRPKFGRLPKDERRVAKRICGFLERRTHLTEADFELVALYAAADVRYHKFKDQLEAEGWTVQGEDGPKDHPAVKHFTRAESVMISCLDRLGLTPAARDKIKKTKEKEDPKPVDPMEELLNRPRAGIVPFEVPAPSEPDDDFANAN